MMKQKLSKALLVLAALLGLVMVFQNCGPSSQFQQDDASALFSAAPLQQQTIEYRYKAATPVYFEFHMVKAESDPQSNFENFDMIGVATLSDGSEARLNYEIEVLDRNNLPVCPAYADFLAPGFTRIQETCSKQKASVIKKITFRIQTPDGVWHRYVKNY